MFLCKLRDTCRELITWHISDWEQNLGNLEYGRQLDQFTMHTSHIVNSLKFLATVVMVAILNAKLFA